MCESVVRAQFFNLQWRGGSNIVQSESCLGTAFWVSKLVCHVANVNFKFLLADICSWTIICHICKAYITNCCATCLTRRMAAVFGTWSWGQRSVLEAQRSSALMSVYLSAMYMTKWNSSEKLSRAVRNNYYYNNLPYTLNILVGWWSTVGLMSIFYIQALLYH